MSHPLENEYLKKALKPFIRDQVILMLLFSNYLTLSKISPAVVIQGNFESFFTSWYCWRDDIIVLHALRQSFVCRHEIDLVSI